MPRTLVIGDIHGCSAALAALLAEMDVQPDDTLITLGDYIDRGPDSRAVVEQLLPLFDRCRFIPLLGNHEIMLLGSRRNVVAERCWAEMCGGDATLASYGGRLEHVPPAHWEFFERLHRYHETDDHLFVHANYDPQLPLAEQPDDLLFWTHLTRIPPPHVSGKTVVVGHTPQMTGEILDAGHVLCLDTGCFGYGCLTACDLSTRSLWQSEKGGVLLRRPS
jgi:serine/threonine protein phosphatase 1